MNFEEFVCEKLKKTGNVRAKKMFGTVCIIIYDNNKMTP